MCESITQFARPQLLLVGSSILHICTYCRTHQDERLWTNDQIKGKSKQTKKRSPWNKPHKYADAALTFLRTAVDGGPDDADPLLAFLERAAHDLVHLRVTLALVDQVDAFTVPRVTFLSYNQLHQWDHTWLQKMHILNNNALILINKWQVNPCINYHLNL